MYTVFTKPQKKKNKKSKNPQNEYSKVLDKRIQYVNDRITKEREEQSKLKFF